MSTAHAKRIQAWRPLTVDQRVLVCTKYKRGSHGTIIEKLDDGLSGMSRYAVKLDHHPTQTADFCRHELRPVKEKTTKRSAH